MKPLLFADVDGVVSREDGEPNGFIPLGKTGKSVDIPDGTTERLERLVAAFDLCWLTAWQRKECEALSRHLRVGPFPYLDHRTSKVLAIIGCIGDSGRPWAWIDDYAPFEMKETGGFGDLLEAGLVVAPNPTIGLTDEHVELALRFARGPAKTPLDGGIISCDCRCHIPIGSGFSVEGRPDSCVHCRLLA